MVLNIFDASQCNKLAETIPKENIQLLQTFVALKTVLEFPHLEHCLNKLAAMEQCEEEDFTEELNSFLESPYGDNDAVNYAVSLKHLQSTIDENVEELIQLYSFIFMENNTFTKKMAETTQQKIKKFLKERDEACMNAIHRLEAYHERKKYEEIFYKVETIL